MEEKEIMVGDIIKFGTSGKYNPGFHTTETYIGQVLSINEDDVRVLCFNNDNRKACIKTSHIDHVNIELILDWIVAHSDFTGHSYVLANSGDVFEAIWMACALYHKTAYLENPNMAMLEWLITGDVVKVPHPSIRDERVKTWYGIYTSQDLGGLFFKVLLTALKRTK